MLPYWERAMKRAVVAFAIPIAVAACASRATRTAEPSPWQAGRYSLEAAINYSSGGFERRDEHRADLLISSQGEMSMFSSSGVCLDPDALQQGADQAGGKRTFQCGPVRYELRPAGGTVLGRIFTTVTEERVTTVCVKYATTPEGNRVCVETQEKREQIQTNKSASLQVRTRPDSPR